MPRGGSVCRVSHPKIRCRTGRKTSVVPKRVPLLAFWDSIFWQQFLQSVAFRFTCAAPRRVFVHSSPLPMSSSTCRFALSFEFFAFNSELVAARLSPHAWSHPWSGGSQRPALEQMSIRRRVPVPSLARASIRASRRSGSTGLALHDVDEVLVRSGHDLGNARVDHRCARRKLSPRAPRDNGGVAVDQLPRPGIGAPPRSDKGVKVAT